jgi:hypothetical protein
MAAAHDRLTFLSNYTPHPKHIISQLNKMLAKYNFDKTLAIVKPKQLEFPYYNYTPVKFKRT